MRAFLQLFGPLVLWAWAGFAVVTRVNVFGIHGSGFEGGVLALALIVIEMSVWFAPPVLFFEFRKRRRDPDFADRPRDILLQILFWGFMGFLFGALAMFLLALAMQLALGQEEASRILSTLFPL